ncbi:tRNA pseudouridine(38-40) synthase TruA [Nocardioides sp.]|uniref:tRNA pseudouridine(38-40) synthase TruA n=1 Tax=Nocardioides sp. TaxID=35761 RepID=UPI001A1FB787|nr:tRNA pseudouridine(38-40) synthase TruA [Nocardioides sp.]MBJ7358794.1 tRNA pseudouridine(38-40) synthase TruA [Nocardioides sp.]
MRIRLHVAYDGGDFRGWAAQPGLRTVEGELSTALATVLRVPSVDLTCAGRTDAGVHARGQVVHVDLAALPEGTDQLVRRVNGVLATDLRVLRAAEAPPGFDARFSALWRRYVYRVVDDVASVDPLARGHVLVWPRPLDVAALDEASRALRGLHDFASFCRRREGATTIRTLLDLGWTRRPDGVVEAGVRADAFCHSMVRSLVGCLLAVGEGRRPVDWPAQVLVAGRRDPAVTVAPALGLTLEEVGYPADDELATRAETTRARRA